MSNCPPPGGLAALELSIAEVEAAERHLIAVTERARAQLHESVAALTRVANGMWTELDSSADLRAIAARRLYWGVTSLPPDNIAVALGYRSKREMTAAAGEFEAGVNCEDCGVGIRASSRAELKALAAARTRSAQRISWQADELIRCRPCKRAHTERQRQQWMAPIEQDDTIIAGPWEL